MKHIGLDLHSTTTEIWVLNERGRKMRRAKVPTREAELVAFLTSIDGDKQVALEESQMADFVTRIIEPYVTKVVRCLPQHNRLISESEKKCDAEDARFLAELLYMNRLKAVHHSPWAFRQLREGVRAYYTASRDLTRAKSRLKAFYLFNGIHCQGDTVYSSRSRAAYIQQIERRSGNLHLLDELYRRLDFFRDSKAEHIKTLRELGPLLPDGQQVLRRLMTYPGIGFIGACTVAAYVEDGRRLSNKRRLWQYCGLGIRRHESAGTGRQGASRQGNRYLKNVFMTAAAAIAANRNGDNALSRKWIADVGSGQHPARVKRNLARKLAVLTQRSLRTKEEYIDERVRTP